MDWGALDLTTILMIAVPSACILICFVTILVSLRISSKANKQMSDSLNQISLQNKAAVQEALRGAQAAIHTTTKTMEKQNLINLHKERLAVWTRVQEMLSNWRTMLQLAKADSVNELRLFLSVYHRDSETVKKLYQTVNDCYFGLFDKDITDFIKNVVKHISIISEYLQESKLDFDLEDKAEVSFRELVEMLADSGLAHINKKVEMCLNISALDTRNEPQTSRAENRYEEKRYDATESRYDEKQYDAEENNDDINNYGDGYQEY